MGKELNSFTEDTGSGERSRKLSGERKHKGVRGEEETEGTRVFRLLVKVGKRHKLIEDLHEE